ncbi:MAG: hypothetical protein Q7T49_02885 [bacterium]|nr:hypothetical protein [bacterium]
MWFSLLSKKAKGSAKFTALFDIGTGSVTASVISLPGESDKACPTIVWHQSAKLDFSTRPDRRQLLLKILAAAQEVAGALQREWPALIEEAHIVLSSPFYRGLTKTVEFDHDEPFIFNQELLDKIRDDEMMKYLNMTKKPFDDIPQDQAIMLEYRLLAIKADGNEVTEPTNQKIRSLELTEYLSTGSEAISRRLREIIIGAGHFKRLNFHSYLLTLSAVLSALYKDGDFLVVDAGGERTDVGLVKNGLLVNQYIFSLSPKHLARLSEQKSLTVSAEAKTLANLDPKHKLWEQGKTDWLDNFKQALTKFGPTESWPQNIFVGAEAHYNSILVNWLKELNFKPVVISSEWLANWCELAPGLKGVGEHWILAEAMFLSQVASETTVVI